MVVVGLVQRVALKDGKLATNIILTRKSTDARLNIHVPNLNKTENAMYNGRAPEYRNGV